MDRVEFTRRQREGLGGGFWYFMYLAEPYILALLIGVFISICLLFG